jgi:site-specific recombinase XerD
MAISMNFIDAHEKFLDYLTVIKNKSPRTVEQYDRHLRKFSEYLEEENIDSYNFPVDKITLKISE